MDTINLLVDSRPREAAPAALRRQDQIPGVVYGKGVEPVLIAVSASEFAKVYKAAGETTIINLLLDDPKASPLMTLIKDIQLSPDRDEYLHVDFYRVRVGEKLRVEVPLKFENDPPAIKNLGGILVTNKNEVEVECLPKNLPHEIIVDLSGLEKIDDAVLVKDLKVPDAVTILDNVEEMIAVIAPPAVEEVTEVVSEAEAVASVEATAEKLAEGMENKEKSAEETPDKQR